MSPSSLVLRFASFILSTALLIQTADAALIEHWWNISYATTNPDGLFERRAIGVNGSWPPPPVVVNQNDTLRIHAFNGLSDVGTALHSHGIYFNGSAYYDGAVGVSQCGIPPGQSLTYDIPVANQDPGTYWIHGHYKGQYVDGLRTPFVINPSGSTPAPYHYDDEYIVVLGDWYHKQHAVLLNKYMSVSNPTGAEPVPDSGLIYFSHSPTQTYLPGFNENATLPFEPGKTYRLRLINTGGFAMFYFWIDGHDMRIIEVDGVDTQELPVSQVTLAAAQRLSVLVTARNDMANNWAIHANMDASMFDIVPPNLQLNVTSKIQYNASAPLFPPSTADAYGTFDDVALVPYIPQGMVDPDSKHDLNVFFTVYSDGYNHASFNNVTYESPIVPSIFTQLSMGALADDVAVYGPQTNAVLLKNLDMVEVTIYNWDKGLHPFHLHGHKFQVVHKSQNVSSDDPTINPPFNNSQVNPMRRDTVQVFPGGATTIRFRADNPGTWIFHCHIEWHLESGLAAVFVSSSEQAQQRLSPPREMYEQCAAQGISTTGNAGGLNSTTDFGLAPTGPHLLELGWTPRAKGALAGCVITAMLGMATVVWYSLGGPSEMSE